MMTKTMSNKSALKLLLYPGDILKVHFKNKDYPDTFMIIQSYELRLMSLKTYKISRAFENYIDLKRTLDKACKEITRLRDSEELDKFLNVEKYELVKKRGQRNGTVNQG